MNNQVVGNIISSHLNNVNTNMQNNSPKEEHVKRFRVIHTIIILVDLITLTVSIIILCRILPRTETLQFDYIGVIIAILSILVTVLIGWNVYSIIDLRKYSEKYKTDTQTLANLLYTENYGRVNYQMQTEQSLFDIYHYLVLKQSPLGLEYNFLLHGLCTLQSASQNEHYELCNELVKALNEIFVDTSKIKMNSVAKNGLLNIYSSIPNKDKIENINSIILKIAQIK